MNWQLVDDETMPALLVLPPAAASLDEAHAAIELWEHYSKKRLDPTQKLTVEVMMAETAEGRWAAATTGREMPRQGGKGDEIEVPELWGLVQRAEAILHTVHDAVLLASQAQQRMLGVLEGHPDLRRLVKRKWQGTGQQMIEMRNGGVIWYRTRTGGGGRGVDDIDRLVVDEAQHATEEHLAAVAPTLLANKNPQLNAMGTAALAGKSDWWWSVRKRALGPDPGAFGYVGHTAETVRMVDGRVVQDRVDVEDRSLWRKANPSIVAGRGQGMAFFEEQLRRLGPRAFAQEHLGVWDPSGTESEIVVPVEAWADCQTTKPVDGEPLVFAIDVAPLQTHAAIAGAGTIDGLPAALVLESHQDTAWLLPAMRKLRAEHPNARFVAAKNGPAGSVFPDAEKDGIELHAISTQDHAAACSALLAKVTERRMRHRPDPVLDAALAGAVKRDLGDGAWTWSRRSSLVNIAPLVAFTLALAQVGDVESVYETKGLITLG